MVVGEGAAPSRHANLAFSRAYKTPLHGWCCPPFCGIVLLVRSSLDRINVTLTYIVSRREPRLRHRKLQTKIDSYIPARNSSLLDSLKFDVF